MGATDLHVFFAGRRVKGSVKLQASLGRGVACQVCEYGTSNSISVREVGGRWHLLCLSLAGEKCKVGGKAFTLKMSVAGPKKNCD